MLVVAKELNDFPRIMQKVQGGGFASEFAGFSVLPACHHRSLAWCPSRCCWWHPEMVRDRCLPCFTAAGREEWV